MIIRSQNKAFIINFEKVDTVCLDGFNGKGVIAFTNAQVVTLGEYSTEEKAIKVLDAICNNYQDCEMSKSRLRQLAKIEFVFQMPQDFEV